MPVVIQISNLSKIYRLGEIGTGTISRDFERWYKMKIRRQEDPFLKIGEANVSNSKGVTDFVYALKDINIEIERGDAIGIIGKNGAGKSTLLKIISRITSPTTGKINIKGRIASLLEVGTGFHPELTGRENIYLNGAILGMRKKEITRKLDAIIDFSGIERYIDTPVKRYSSGMYVRLAFAVAAHLESEIMIIDEVLAVGDAEFQKKCLGKMGEVTKGEGRTVLFVSHNMAAVTALCSKGIVLENGVNTYTGGSSNAVVYYLKGNSESQNVKLFNNTYDKNEFTLHEISLKKLHGISNEPLLDSDIIELKTSITFKSDNADNYHITYHLVNELGEGLFSFSDSDFKQEHKTGLNNLICKFPKSFFQTGTFYLSIFIIKEKKECVFHEKDIMSFTVVDGVREFGSYMGREPGFIRPAFEWSIQ